MTKNFTTVTNKFAALFTSLLLSVMLVPASAFALPDEEESVMTPTSDQIQDLLDNHDYIEGDVIVVAEAGADLTIYAAGENLDREGLAEVNDTAMELTAEAAKESSNATSVISAERAEKSNAPAYEISVIHSDTLSTAEMIDALYRNPAVISASPNYVTDTAVAYAAEDDSSAEPATDTPMEASSARDGYKPFGVHDPDVGDLSSLQWALGGAYNSGTVNTLEGQNIDVGLDVPGYDGRGGGALNSDETATIGVLDSGMDVTHPDLQDVFYTFTEEQQARWGCGEHGYNATVPYGDEKAGDLTDTVDHGTHVSGIMSAAWDGQGTAGVANGAKLIGIRLSADNGAQTAEGSIRGFKFAATIAKEVNLKAVNCSWSSNLGSIEFIFTLLVNNLGEQGVVTVFAAGNERVDVDQQIDTPSFIDSPYLINVGCLSPSGIPSMFSNWGETEVDVFAPGGAILSTVPTTTHMGEAEVDYNKYYPQAEQGVLSCVRFSDGTEGGVTVYNDDPVEHPEAIVTAQVLDKVGIDDMYSLAIPHDQFHEIEGKTSPVHAPEEYVYLKIPAGTADPTEISYVSAEFTADFGVMSVGATLYGFMGVTAYGRPKIVNFDAELGNYYNSASVRTNKVMWGNATMNIDYMLEADEDADEVYLDDHGNMIVVVRLMEFTNYDEYTPVETLYVDDITVGSSEGHPSNHQMFNGTSMAAPAVTAACAVVSRGETPNASFDDEDLAMQAIKRSARLRAATVQADALSGKCATGGYVRLTGYGDMDVDSMPMAPTIASAEVVDGTVEVEGWFFKASGHVYIDGVEATPASWSDGKVTFALPQDVENGRHILTIATDEGQDKFQLQVSEESGHGSVRLYEYELSTPDVWASDWIYGPNATSGGLCASGNYIYTFQRDINSRVCAFWRYDIAADTWELCPLPFENPELTDTCLAATDTGVVFLTNVVIGKDEYGFDKREAALFDYDASSNSWTRRDFTFNTSRPECILSRGKDLFFVQLGLPDDEGDYDTYLLGVLRDGSDRIEPLEQWPDDYEYSNYYAMGMIAAMDGRYVYITASEPITDGNTHTPSPKALFRLMLDENDRAVDFDAFDGELVELGITASGDGLLHPVVAAAPCGGIVVGGNGSIASDTFLWEGGSDELVAHDRTSSYFRSNLQAAVYHDGKLYVLGYSSSENGKMFFRATDLAMDHTWNAGEVTTEPTCGDPGEKAYTCIVCGETKTGEIAATGEHAWGEPTYKWAADYSSVTATRVCNNNAAHVETETVKTTSKVAKTATCTEKGKTTYTTKAFKNTAFKSQTKTVANIDVAGHKLTKLDAVPATCEETGMEAYWQCSECEKLFSDAKGTKEISSPATVAALGHAWGEWTTVKEPTATEAGLKERICGNDSSHVQQQEIPATGGDEPDPENPEDVAWTRLAGDNALATMGAIVDAGGFAKGGTVVLASLEGYWDALTAAGIAGLEQAPVLMALQDSLGEQTAAQLKALAPSRIIVCGGTYWIPDEVVQMAVDAAGTDPEVERLAGEVAVNTAEDIARAGNGKWSGTAIIATVGTFQDALAAAPLSYARQMPIYLAQFDFATETGSLAQSTIESMKANGITKAYIAGGTYWLPDSIEGQLTAAGIEFAGRLAGETAVETSAAIAAEATAALGFSADGCGLANVAQHYDALASAAFCGKSGSVLLLASDLNRSSIDSFVKGNAAAIGHGYVFGGAGSVSDATMSYAEEAAASK